MTCRILKAGETASGSISAMRATMPPSMRLYNTRLTFSLRKGPDMLSIRAAAAEDVPLLRAMILELAVYEKLDHKTVVSDADLLRDGFGAHPKFRALLAYWNGQPAGYALFFEFYSSFQGRPGIFLEDIFVRPAFRKKGIGKELLAQVAKIAQDENYFCLRWEVLDWNQLAIDFYRQLGATFMDEWKAVRLTGDALAAVAVQAR